MSRVSKKTKAERALLRVANFMARCEARALEGNSRGEIAAMKKYRGTSAYHEIDNRRLWGGKGTTSTVGEYKRETTDVRAFYKNEFNNWRKHGERHLNRGRLDRKYTISEKI